MKTTFYCDYDLKDTTAIEDSAPQSTCNQEFADISLLKDNIAFDDYATLEENYFTLDGKKQEFPDEPRNIVYFSNQMSGADGCFKQNPMIDIRFTQNHTSIGLKFYFIGDYPEEMNIEWYNLKGNLISRKSFKITESIFFARNQVEDYGRVVITFTKAKPYRYVKMHYIEYGTNLLFGADGYPIKDAKLIEEADPISDKIAINKLSYCLIDENNEFDIANRYGLHKSLQKGQKMNAYENVDGERILLGKFFLSTSSTNKNVTSMNCVDFKGLLDNSNFREGKVYNGELAGDIIDDIMAAAGIIDYSVDDATRETPLYGWLKIQTCRKALREVLFACGSVIDSSRSEGLNIYKQERLIQSAVKRTRKFSTSTEIKEYISDVSIKFPVYEIENESKEVAKGSYAAGIHTVEFSSPISDLTINTGAIISQAVNYVAFELTEAADVVISGYKYAKEELSVTTSVESVRAGQIRKTKSFSGALLNVARANEIAQSILDYYALQLGIKIKFLNQGEKPADWAEIYNANKKYGSYVAGFEKITTDLTGGFVSTAELRGYYKLLSDSYFTGEIFTGEGLGIL